VRLDILQAQWLTLAIGIGIVLTLALVASLMAIWKPRRDANLKQIGDYGGSSLREVFSAIPWIIWLTYAGSIIYGIIAFIFYMIQPPNV
jgi:hypothetical protein